MGPFPQLAPELRRALDRQLIAGERVLWAAQPRGNRLWSGFGIWIFAIPWTAFALFWESMALIPLLQGSEAEPYMKYGFGIVFPLFGIPFVLIGFAMLWAPIRAMRKARKIVHALTDRRLLTMELGRTSEVKSAFVDRIGPVERSEGSDGWGSVKVQTHSKFDGDGDRVTERFELLGIPDVARLERLILEQQAKH